ncbi:MAG: glycolate oxidase subunit GlcE [Gammaproteobacteria bacterium]|nr:glycolate oxidase subunit GlcE [Gammaproteobacteria bacterium]
MTVYNISKESDQTEALLNQVQTACENSQPLAIQGNGTRSFLIHSGSDQVLSTSLHRGIVNYFPSELTVTVRSGTLLSELNDILAKEGQMLPFEPPHFSNDATIGGVIASGLSGSSRPFSGSVRDYVLGCRIINGRGEILQLGGEVMKNVAGYDLSRLVTGSYGSLAVILEVSLKLLPIPAQQKSFCLELQTMSLNQQVKQFMLAGYPITSACQIEDMAYIRLSGSEKGVDYSYNKIQQDFSQLKPVEDLFWSDLNEQKLPFFDSSRTLWRLSLPTSFPENKESELEQLIGPNGRQLIDWGGALRWIYSEQSAENIRQFAKSCGGHAQLFYVSDKDKSLLKEMPKQQPLSPVLFKLHQQIKKAIDPHSLFNSGCIYPEL